MKKALIIFAAVYVAGVAYCAWKKGRLDKDAWAWPFAWLFTPAASQPQPNGTSQADILGRTIPDPPARTAPTRTAPARS